MISGISWPGIAAKSRSTSARGSEATLAQRIYRVSLLNNACGVCSDGLNLIQPLSVLYRIDWNWEELEPEGDIRANGGEYADYNADQGVTRYNKVSSHWGDKEYAHDARRSIMIEYLVISGIVSVVGIEDTYSFSYVPPYASRDNPCFFWKFLFGHNPHPVLLFPYFNFARIAIKNVDILAAERILRCLSGVWTL